MYMSNTKNFVGKVTSEKDSIGNVDNFDKDVFAHMIVPQPDPVIVAGEYWTNDHKNSKILNANEHCTCLPVSWSVHKNRAHQSLSFSLLHMQSVDKT